MKNIITAVFLLTLMVAAGCTNRKPISRDDSKEIFIFADLSINEIRQIILEVEKIDADPILSITDQERERKEIEVHTGFVRGPLDGGGKSYILKFIEKRWVIVSNGFWVS